MDADKFEKFMTQGKDTSFSEYAIEQLVAACSDGPADFRAGMEITKPELMCIYFSKLASMPEEK